MSEPATPLLATGGLTFFGIVTGLHPMLLVAGFVGCWWYNSYLSGLTLRQRIVSGVIAALVAAWVTPPVISWLTALSWWPPTVPALTAGFPAALVAGFLTHKVIGPALLRSAEKKVEEIT
jgi:fructose-specific phosphotransferase system IIC component